MSLFALLERQRRVVYLAVAGLSAAGLWAAVRLPAAIYPELAFPRIAIVASGVTLGAHQMVFAVARPLEQAISIVPGVTRVRSRSIRGGTEMSVFFSPTTEMNIALQRTQQRVTQVLTELPLGISVEVERMTPSLFPILSYNLEGGDPAVLYDLARYEIAPVISRIPSVGRVDVQGAEVREIEVVAEPARLAELGLSYDDLADAIRAAVTPAAVGRVNRDYHQFLVVTDQEAHSADDVANVVVRPGLRVRDVASVRLGTEDRVSIVAGNGRPAALINIARQPGGNTLQLADSVARTMAALQRTLPAGVRLRPVYDQAHLVRASVTSVRDAMFLGAALAVLVLAVFLRHWRITAISAAAIPVTMSLTVFVLWLTGGTINLMSLGAMAIATGLVIDDAVVVVENVVRHLAFTPGDRRRAVSEALQELLWPVTTSTLTTVVVFLPLGLLEGVVGQFFKTLSITLTIAVLVSLLVAVTLIPLLSARFVREQDQDAPAVDGKPAKGYWLDAVTSRYERLLAAALRQPRRVIAVATLLGLAGVLLWRSIETGFMPEMDEGAFVFDYFNPGGTALDVTDGMVHQAENIILAIPEVQATARRTGAELGLFATQQTRGDMVVRLVPENRRRRDIFAIMDEARTKVSAAVPRMRIEFIQILADVIGDLAGAAEPVEVKLFGDRLEDLESYAQRLAPSLEKIDGLVDFYDGVSEPTSEMLLKVREDAASRLGLTPAQVGAAVSGALLGVVAGEVRTEDRAIGIRVRAPDSLRFDAARLTSIPVRGRPGVPPTPLGVVATARDTSTRAELLRENQRQMIAITGRVEGRSLGPVVDDVRAVLDANPPPRGVTVELGGQYASQQESFRALLLVLVLAALSVVTVMVVQFSSFVEPVVVLLAAPVSFAGALVLLHLTGTPLNVSSLMGLILLVGLVVKNGIILLDFTQRLMQREGLALAEALRQAAKVRLRPILMTTLCTLFGLLPLALGLGSGSELQRPLALAVIGGLALSTPVTLLMVPALLVAIRGAGYRRSR